MGTKVKMSRVVFDSVKDEMIKKIKETEETDDTLFCKKTEADVHLYGNFSDRSAYHFVLHIIKERPQILEDLKKKL